jgi:hypothetical protein
VRKKPALEAARNRMQVASRKNSLPSPQVAEAVLNRVQLAPQNSRQSRQVVEAVLKNSAVCTIKNNNFRLLFLGIQQQHSLKTLQKDQLKIEHDWRAAILCLL